MTDGLDGVYYRILPVYPSVPHPTWGRTVDKEMWADRVSWRGKAKGRRQWRSLVVATRV